MNIVNISTCAHIHDSKQPQLMEADMICSCSSSADNLVSKCRECRNTSMTSSSSSWSLWSLDSYKVEEYNQIWRVLVASLKGFTIGAGLKGGLAIFALLPRIKRGRKSIHNQMKQEIASRSADVLLALKETLRYGLFLGAFAGTFVSVDEIITSLGGHRRTAKWRALLAGAIAGPSMLLTGLDGQHNSLAIYILMRAAVLASRCGIKSKRFGKLCKPLTWAHGDIFLMCLSSSQILSAYILKQESLAPSYKSFLNKHGAKNAVVLQGMRDLACGLPISNIDAVEKYYKSTGLEIKLDPHMKVPCTIIHENQSCGAHFISFLIQAYQRALPVYIPVYLVPALLVHRKGLLRRPYTILAKGLLGTARSSLFLSMYCSSAWMWTCFLFRLLKKCNIPMVVVGTFPTGLALAIEKKSRRLEISLYCLARAIESFFICMGDIGCLPKSKSLKRIDVLVFSISTAIIMHCYAIEREVFRSKYLNVLDWVFGVPIPLHEVTPRKNRSRSKSCPDIFLSNKDQLNAAKIF